MDMTAYTNMFSNSGEWGSMLKNQWDTSGPKVVPPKPAPINARDIVFSATSLGLGAGNGTGSGYLGNDTGAGFNFRNFMAEIGGVVSPSGETLAPSGSESTDFLNRIFGPSPLGSTETTSGEQAETLGGFGDLGNWFGRVAVVLLGFIFVGVGLAMFKSPVVAVVQKAVAA